MSKLVEKCFLSIVIIFAWSVMSFAQIKQDTIFKFQLNHIDISVDSVTLYSLMSNKFIKNTFSSTKLFRDSTGTDILVRGKLHWLHFLPDKGFYKNRLGAVILAHENFTWLETDTIIKHLHSFTKDSLYNRPYTSGGENTAHVHIYENLADSLSLLKFIPQLQNFRKSDYFNWGYTEADLANGISQKRNMQDYVGKETSDKLFESIKSINVSLSPDEMKRIPPLMKGYGYIRKGNKFLLNGSPIVVVTAMKKAKRSLIVHMRLAESVFKQKIHVSDNALLILKGKDAWFHYSVIESENTERSSVSDKF